MSSLTHSTKFKQVIDLSLTLFPCCMTWKQEFSCRARVLTSAPVTLRTRKFFVLGSGLCSVFSSIPGLCLLLTYSPDIAKCLWGQRVKLHSSGTPVLILLLWPALQPPCMQGLSPSQASLRWAWGYWGSSFSTTFGSKKILTADSATHLRLIFLLLWGS